ncbi:phosphohydrolase [Bacillus coahuilensis p1.1.43]|uniref:Phosphohydrolase n=1 Tax=Bacillus coahuilensis p1.1.43 TaxID=1150625 RepID=A0A147K8G9_9BACI|nr:HD domain-containing protein [Bacillus coahuilensis]KUP06501.1 phosphohydrolase [Bacillus coahuilensis p1.1.43]
METYQHIYQNVKNYFDGEGTGHGFDHIERVNRLAIEISKREESGNLKVISYASLLHDVTDDKIRKEDSENFLNQCLVESDLTNAEIRVVREMITSISYKGGNGPSLKSMEAMIVQDADRLDAMGAIGVARAFTYGGSKGRPLFKEDERPREYMTLEEYRNGNTSTVLHFYEKLLLLKNKMNTETGKRMAEERHQFMEHFLNVFMREWKGEV